MARELLPWLTFGALLALLGAVLARRVAEGRLAGRRLLLVLAPLFLLDAARRDFEQCPSGAPGLLTTRGPAVEAVAGQMPRGRFYDDGADDPATAVRRSEEAGGFDPLRPIRGVFFGIRYAGENDVDRMTPAASVAFTRELARLPWGAEKALRLEAAGVSVARTASPGPDPAGVRELLRTGGDRIVALTGTRPELSAEGTEEARIEVVRRTATFLEARVTSRAPTRLRVLRTYDPNLVARVDGIPAATEREGPFTALALPAGNLRVELRYANRLIGAGAVLSGLSAGLAMLLLARKPRGGRG